ncbi:MAG: NAD-dependent epimerase/dehydratase family protein [Candidatus Nanopelagicales bacterium]|nr:NAD-dependent epimerase/dehydratase family protein [Candidatus Nanopelagicales bacterium]
MGRVVLVTGVARYLGGQLARILSQDPAVDQVLGVDVVPPKVNLPGMQFVRADIRNTVVHMGVIATPRQAGGRATMKEINVIGTMQLLAACQRTPSVKALVVKSTASVYGSGPKAPALFTEEMQPRHAPRSGWAKDSVEVEGYVRGFARRRPDVAVTTLRFANFIGPGIDTAMTTYFSLPVIPTVLGFDARLQFIHEDDGLEFVKRAVLGSYPGTFNVSGNDILMLSQAIRRTGHKRVALPEFLFTPFGRNISRAGLIDFTTEQVAFASFLARREVSVA